MDRINLTSSMRRGLHYEEVWGLLFSARWLEDPSLFESIRFQTTSEGAEKGPFFLDDIVIRKRDGTYEFYQLKYKVHPDTDEWTWKILCTPQNSSKDSLLKKWSGSLAKVKSAGKVSKAAFITNGKPSQDVKAYLTEKSKININAVKEQLPQVYVQVKDEVGEHNLQVFFGSFEFLFSQPSLSEIEESAKNILLGKLKVTESGFNSFLLKLRQEFERPVTRALYLSDLRSWCEFDVPRPLNEDFEVPTDFQWFDLNIHKRLLENIMDLHGGVKVIVGKPGSGKSTYVSKLVKMLEKRNVVCVRHHYHISPNDPNPQERLRAGRVCEAIKAQFKEYPNVIGNLANKNSGEVELSEFIDEAARNAVKSGKAFVLIIDGLDHASRYEDPKELENLLYQVCQPQPGIWIILGMQEVAGPYLPAVVNSSCPEDHWTWIAGLSMEATEQLIRRNIVDLVLPPENTQLKSFLARIYEITKGNPLHLRYTLRQLKIQNASRQVSEYDLENLAPYDDDIQKYYDALWGQIPEAGRTFLFALNYFESPVKEEEFLDLAGRLVKSVPEISSGYEAISHLLIIKKNRLSFFHNSIQIYVSERKEEKEQRPELRRRIKNWIEGSQYDHLKWSLLPIVEYELGKLETILALDRHWLIEALIYPRSQVQISRLLSASAKAAFESEKYGKVFEASNLGLYLENTKNSQPEIAERLWCQAMENTKPRAADIELEGLGPSQIAHLVSMAEKQGEWQEMYDDALKEIEKKHRAFGFRESQIPPDISIAQIKTCSIDGSHSVHRIIKYITQFRDLGFSGALLNKYVETLLKRGRYKSIKTILSGQLSASEKSVVIESLTLDALCKDYARFDRYLSTHNLSSLPLVTQLYLLLRGRKIPSIAPLPGYNAFPLSVSEYDTKERYIHAELYQDTFILGLIYGFSGLSVEVKKWISNAEDRWALNVMRQLFQLALDVSDRIKRSEKIDLSLIASHLSKVEPLRWPEDRSLIGLQNGFHLAVEGILKVMCRIKQFREKEILVDYQVLASIPREYFGRYHLLKFLVEWGEPFLSSESCQKYLLRERVQYLNEAESFPERVEHYLDLCELAGIHEKDSDQRQFLRLAASNFIGYGYHKDYFFGFLIDSIKSAHTAGSAKALSWIHRVAPMLENVREFTDGDEVNHLPGELGESLSIIDPGLLRKYYYWTAARQEKLFLSEEIFKYVLRTLDFGNPVNMAIASTALDKESLTELRALSAPNSAASMALQSIETYYGNIQYRERDYSSPSFHKPPIQDEIRAVSPKNLSEHLDKISNNWERSEFLKLWGKIWLSEENPKKNEAFRTLRGFLNDQHMDRADPALLDQIFEFEREINKDSAFNILCWAQANDSGWALYWTSPEKAEKRWRLVEEYYPNRFHEFFRNSITRTRLRFNKPDLFSFPIPRSIEYFGKFNRIDIIEDVLESAVSFAEGLMGDLKLPKSKWLTNDAVDNIDILLLRLIWPSPFVRERAATAIADLIGGEPQAEEVFTRLLSWISKQQLESLVAVGLLPIVKAAELGHRKHLNLQAVVSSLPITNIVIQELINRLLHLLGESTKVEVGIIQALDAPTDYETSSFFIRYHTSFLPPIYSDFAKFVEETSVRAFTRQWSYNSSRLLEERDIPENTGDALEFLGRPKWPQMTGMSTLISEVYRSAFLRVLRRYYDEGSIPLDAFREFSYKTLPVDISFWRIAPSRRPEWWPFSSKQVIPGQVDTQVFKAESKKTARSLFDERNDSSILALDGAIEIRESDSGEKFSANAMVIAFGYSILGNRIPDAKSLMAHILREAADDDSSNPIFPFNYLDRSEESEVANFQIGDLVISPLLSICSPKATNLWQWFRGFNQTFKPNQNLNDGLILKIDQTQWQYCQDDSVVVRCGDWLDGIQERHDVGMVVLHGSYVTISKEYLISRLKDMNLRVGYAIRYTYGYRKHEFEMPEITEDYDLVGVSRVII